MSRTSSRFIAPIAASLFVMAGAIVAAPPQDNPSAQLETYTNPEGESYFALSVRPEGSLPAAQSGEVVVLFDTSATQVGVHREKGIDALRGLLAALNEKDRVKLLAVDLNAVALTKGFVPPQGADIQAGLEKLSRRTPLGSTDLDAALASVLDSFQATSTAPRAVAYIGDGQSNASLAGANLPELINRMVEARIAVHSFAVGPSNNVAGLAAMANQTGGMVVLDGENVTGREMGTMLATAVHQSVVWPAERKLPESMAQVYPAKMPPLRPDRETVLIGKGAADKQFTFEVTGTADGQPVELRWEIVPGKPQEDNAYLGQLVELAAADGGRNLPTLGSQGLNEARRVLNAGAHTLTQLGQQAAAAGDVGQAKQFVDEAVRRDPSNPNALVLKRVLDDGSVHPAQAALPPQPEPAPSEPLEGDLLQSVEQMQRVIRQKVMAETTVELNRLRDLLRGDPSRVLDELKQLQQRVDSVGELTSEERADLRNRIAIMFDQSRQRLAEKEALDAQIAENAAAARERERLLNNLERKEDRITGLVDRFNSLMEEGYRNFDMVNNPYFRDAKDRAADEIRRVASNPYGRPEVVAKSSGEFAMLSGYHAQNMAVREAEQRAYLDTLHLVDVSMIPFPDIPPIVYPDVNFWRRVSERPKKWGTVDLAKPGAAEEKILEELDEKTDLEFAETPLSDAVTYIRDKHGIEMQFDQTALRDANIDPSTVPITRTLKGVTLRSALKLILSEHNLTYIIDNEVLLVTTKEKADATLVTKVYPVGDLVVPIQAVQSNPFQLGGGVGGGGGGGGGGLGGGGGGFGGGGQGGGGGGFGGGGQGGGGGGIFNVVDDVNDPLPGLGSGGASARPSDVKPAADAKPVTANTADPEKFWNDYFASLATPDEADAAEISAKRDSALRTVATELMTDRKFDQVIALIQAGLNHGHVYPWMYEALALAMQAADRPKEDIERALMSAVDFAQTSSDVMHVALYMSRIGLDARALKLLRQASALEPYRHEPYMHGLQIAQRLGDTEGLRWACLGVLSQAWPNSQSEIVSTAKYTASALIEKLRKEGHTAQADEFRKALDAAQVRDCVVNVSWTGDADLDIMVEEPTGAVCSFRTQRTPGGGVMLGDTYARTKRSSAEGYSESYVLPQGFSGQYKVLIRRVWGQVATGKATVDVHTHAGTPEATHIRKQIPLGQRDAMVVFDLADGRRHEPLAQAQIAQATARQAAVNRTVLAQQIQAIEEPLRGRDRPGVNPGVVQRPGSPFFIRPAVGYQPVITTLPEGTNMSAVAVISADRRYVRVSAVPLFSLIGPIEIFNFTTGQSSMQGGGTGGGTGGGGGGVP